MLIDSHCHLQDRKFAPDMEDVIARAREAGVTGMVVVGYDMPSSRRALGIAEGHTDIWATVGVHPHDAKDVTPRDLDELEQMAASPEVVAIGEIGLDFFRDLSPRDVQKRVFREQLALARRVQLPVVIHSRDADEECFAVLAAHAPLTRPALPESRQIGVMHTFAGDLALALRYIAIGFSISLSGTVTYPAAEKTRDVARGITLDRMAVETDSPYLPPQSIRGQRNEPARARDVAEYVAELRGESFETVSERTARTAELLFGISTASGNE